MIGRSSIKKLTDVLFYQMSKKKLTQQWRKPIEQLRQQKQQNTPIPQQADHIKKVAIEFMQKQYAKPGLKIDEEQSAKKSKKFQKKKRQQGKGNELQQNLQGQKMSGTKKASVNWLQLEQFSQKKQLIELTTEALNMSKLKYYTELSQVIKKIHGKFHQEGVQYVLSSLFRHNFLQVYDQLKLLDIQISKLNVRVVNSIIFNLVELEELQRLYSFLNQIKKESYPLVPKLEEFFELLFFKETSQQIAFETGENSVNVSVDNKNLVKKIQIATFYLEIVQEHANKKRQNNRAVLIPIWLHKVAKIVVDYRFGQNQFRSLLSQILSHHEYLIPETFYESQQFFFLLRKFYFGHQECLNIVMGTFERNINKNIKFSLVYKNLTTQLMSYRIQNQHSAFEVDEELINFYKKGFETNNKYLSILSAVIGSDARYKDLAEHYLKSYMIGFPNETLTSEESRFVQDGILNNYSASTDAENHEKNIARLVKQGNNLLTKLKASIKLGQLTQAYKIFEEEALKKPAIERQRKNIQFVLRSQLGKESSNFSKVKDVNQFVSGLSDEYLWSLYKRSQDLSVMLKKYIPSDKFSFWQQKEKKERFEEISRRLARGELGKIKQPLSDIEATRFNLQEYLNSQLPELKQLESQEYQKQKEMIKFTLKIQGLISVHKIHNDYLVAEKLAEIQSELSQENLDLIESFGLKDYNIFQNPWEDFEKRFLQMKQQRNIIKFEKLDWSGYLRFIQRNKSLNNKNIIEEIIIKAPDLFKEAQALVKLNQDPNVNRLLLWGVYANEPMAVYLGEKLAMQTGQLIPHQLALKISRFLSYKRPLTEQFIDRCKQCLKIVGKIDREFIYSFDKEYEHILLRKNFIKRVEAKIDSKRFDNRDLEDLVSYNPREQLYQKQSKVYQDSIVHRAQLL